MTNGYEDSPYGQSWYEPYPYGQFLYEPPHIGHSKHICDMVKKGVGDLNTYKGLVKNPKFICKKCGRAAAKEESLCEPAPL